MDSLARPLGDAVNELLQKEQCIQKGPNLGLLPASAGPSGSKPLAMFFIVVVLVLVYGVRVPLKTFLVLFCHYIYPSTNSHMDSTAPV